MGDSACFSNLSSDLECVEPCKLLVDPDDASKPRRLASKECFGDVFARCPAVLDSVVLSDIPDPPTTGAEKVRQESRKQFTLKAPCNSLSSQVIEWLRVDVSGGFIENCTPSDMIPGQVTNITAS